VAITCTACGSDNADGRRFCDQCGAPIVAACASCGAPNRPGARFCGDCGSPLGAAATGAARGPASASPAVPEAGHARATRAPPGPSSAAERRLVSVLFADLVGFTPFAEDRDPELVRDLLTRYFEATRAVIERHGGVVEKFIGDAVMAAWGAPVAHEDDAERAVRAALEVVDAVRSLGANLEARVGVLSGQAAVTLGAEGQGMVAGDIVNTAARLQSVAPPGTVLVGESTMQAVARAIAFEPAGEQLLKGKQAPLPAWRALRVIGDRGGRVRTEIIEPPFVGRDLELRLLKDLLHVTGSERRPRLVSITGPAGIGKSRLAWEFEKYIDGVVEDVYWHRGRSPSYGEGIAFWALGEMVRRRAGLREEDDEPTTRARIGATVREFVADAADQAWVEPALLALLGVEPTPAGGRDLLFAAWRIFFERVATRGTTVLLFEDLQWADGGLLDFIDHVLEWAKGVPLLVVTLARPELLERRPGWGTSARSFNAIGLEPLTDAQMRELLLGLIPDLPAAATSRILGRAGGVPLYAVETVRMLIADGRLEPAGEGTWRPSGDLGELAVPDSLRALVAARLDALDPDDRALLQVASILGQSFTTGALQAVSDMDAKDLEPRLRGLVRREVLEVSVDPRAPERGQYGFVQAVIREVAYDTLSRGDRRSRHLAAARHFEGQGDEELAGALATHYLAGYEASDPGPEADALQVQARLALRGAAERALSLGSAEQAVAYLRQALDITSSPADRGDLLERAAEAADRMADYTGAESFAREALETFAAGGDEHAVARVSALIGLILADASQVVEAAEFLDSALASVDAASEPEIRSSMLARLARAHMRLGHSDEAIRRADEALAIAEPRRYEGIVAEGLVNKGSALNQVGRWREGSALLAAAIDLASDVGDVALELRARNNYATVLGSEDALRGYQVLAEAHDLALRLGVAQMAVWLKGSMAFVAYTSGDWDRAVALAEEGLQLPASPADRGRFLYTLAEISILRGEDPAGLIDEIEGNAAQSSDPDHQAAPMVLRGHVLLRDGDLEGACGVYRRWLGMASQSATDARVALMRTALRLRDLEQARTALEEIERDPASGMYIDMLRTWARAGLAALEDRRSEAAAGLQEAATGLAARGWVLDGALVKLDALIILPGEPAIAPWFEEARGFFRSIGARPLLELLDRMAEARAG
jgi:class 3 adenylate cyclase/tetratricopeptide (TPR) repeat protein